MRDTSHERHRWRVVERTRSRRRVAVDRLVTADTVRALHTPAVGSVARATLRKVVPAEPAMEWREGIRRAMTVRLGAGLERVVRLLLLVRVVADAAVALVRIEIEVEAFDLLDHLVAIEAVHRLRRQLRLRLG